MSITKLMNLVSIFVLMGIILTACNSSNANSSQGQILGVMAAQAATEAPDSLDETPTTAPVTAEPAVTGEAGTAVEEPTSTEVAITQEWTATEPPTSAEQSSPSPEPTGTQEPTASPVTVEPTEPPITVEPTEPPATGDPTIIHPRDGFWAVNSPDAQVVTVVPQDWLHTGSPEFATDLTEATGESLSMSGFASPDNKAFVYFLIYSDNLITNWNASLAQERALRILNKIYTKGGGDIQVLSIQTMPDGSERLAWSSETCGCHGVIAYKAGPPTPGTVVYKKYLWLFNAFSLNSYDDDYADVFGYAFELLTFPPEESRIAP